MIQSLVSVMRISNFMILNIRTVHSMVIRYGPSFISASGVVIRIPYLKLLKSQGILKCYWICYLSSVLVKLKIVNVFTLFRQLMLFNLFIDCFCRKVIGDFANVLSEYSRNKK